MGYGFYELLWFYLCYSFIGWCFEVAAAAIGRKAFINRGFVTGPVCPIYGFGAVVFALFLPDLKDRPFFLFLGGMILASVIEWGTGKLLEKLFRKKWWDYSGLRFSVDGYICLRYSLLWGLLSLLLLYVANDFLAGLIGMLPGMAGVILAAALLVLLAVDACGTCLAIMGLHKKESAVSQITSEIGRVSKLLENAITCRIQQRMLKAFPAIQEALEEKKETEKPAVFAEGCSFYKLLSVFLIGAFLGDVTETIFCYFSLGSWMSRSSVVYGPFSIIWGLGCVLLTALLYQYRDKNDRFIFAAGVILGGAYEYVCSVFTELAFGTVFWDYSGFAFNLGGRINLLFCFFWGIVAVIWLKLVYPFLSGLIERIPKKPGILACNVLLVFMLFNMLVSGLALSRYTQRRLEENEQKAVGENLLERFLDERFPDERIERIYPKAKIVAAVD